jgi:hypothetical protein
VTSLGLFREALQGQIFGLIKIPLSVLGGLVKWCWERGHITFNSVGKLEY